MTMEASHASAIPKFSASSTDFTTVKDFLLEKTTKITLPFLSAIRNMNPYCEDPSLFPLKEPIEKTGILD